LIDGDGAKFADRYLQDPVSGAEKAAQQLKMAVLDAIKDAHLADGDVSIVVRVYANLKDLSRSLRMSYVIDSDDAMRVFAEQFTNSRAEFDFVNVGKGKENADAKIRRKLSLYFRLLPSCQCSWRNLTDLEH
jgi:hypothetical protein